MQNSGGEFYDSVKPINLGLNLPAFPPAASQEDLLNGT